MRTMTATKPYRETKKMSSNSRVNMSSPKPEGRNFAQNMSSQKPEGGNFAQRTVGACPSARSAERRYPGSQLAMVTIMTSNTRRDVRQVTATKPCREKKKKNSNSRENMSSPKPVGGNFAHNMSSP